MDQLTLFGQRALEEGLEKPRPSSVASNGAFSGICSILVRLSLRMEPSVSSQSFPDQSEPGPEERNIVVIALNYSCSHGNLRRVIGNFLGFAIQPMRNRVAVRSGGSTASTRHSRFTVLRLSQPESPGRNPAHYR
jgi:hypothetical protein